MRLAIHAGHRFQYVGRFVDAVLFKEPARALGNETENFKITF